MDNLWLRMSDIIINLAYWLVGNTDGENSGWLLSRVGMCMVRFSLVGSNSIELHRIPYRLIGSIYSTFGKDGLHNSLGRHWGLHPGTRRICD